MNIQLHNKKMLNLTVQFMRAINQQPGDPVFESIELNEDAMEINFTSVSSISIALEYAANLCQLFNLTLYPHIAEGKIMYSLLK